MSDRRGAIAGLDLADVQAADAGYAFTPDGGSTHPFRGCGVRVPLLEDVLCAWPDARVTVDPKADAAVEPLVALVARLGCWERVCFGSFSDRRLTRLRAMSGGRACTSMGPRAAAVARLCAGSGRIPRQGAEVLQVPLRQGRIRIVNAAFVRAAHGAGLPVHVWTINDRAEMRELLDLGVDAIMTDELHLLREVFEQRGLPLGGRDARGVAGAA